MQGDVDAFGDMGIAADKRAIGTRLRQFDDDRQFAKAAFVGRRFQSEAGLRCRKGNEKRKNAHVDHRGSRGM
jgi:hypothetical protein